MCCLSCKKTFFSQLIRADFIHLSYIHVFVNKRKNSSVSLNLCNNGRSILFFSPSIIHGSTPCLLYKGELSIYHTILAEWWQISGYTVLSFQPFFSSCSQDARKCRSSVSHSLHQQKLHHRNNQRQRELLPHQPQVSLSMYLPI